MGSVQRAAASAEETEGYLSAGKSWCVRLGGDQGSCTETEGSGRKKGGSVHARKVGARSRGPACTADPALRRGRMPSKFEGLAGTPYLHGDDTQLLGR